MRSVVAQTAGMATRTAGRSCRVSYRSRPEDLAQAQRMSAATLYVVGGLYGSAAALDAVLARATIEDTPVLIVFNGDFHYLDVDDDAFRAIAAGVAGHVATRGNVETELASADDEAGCGCGYPDYVDDATVEASDTVVQRLRQTARRLPELVAPLAALPPHVVVEVGGAAVAVLHGDPEHLAGWRLALEAMEPGDTEVRSWTGFRGTGTSPLQVEDWLRRAGVQVIACTHTGLPYLQTCTVDGTPAAVVNNGSAALPCFRGLRAGVLTRLSASADAPPDALYGVRLGGVRCDALPVAYDVDRRAAEFLASWPPGSSAHQSYARRLQESTPLRLSQAARGPQVRVSVPPDDGVGDEPE